VVSKSSEVKERRKRTWSTVITGLQTTLRIVTEPLANAGVPGLQTGLSSLLLVLDMIKVGILCTISHLPVTQCRNRNRPKTLRTSRNSHNRSRDSIHSLETQRAEVDFLKLSLNELVVCHRMSCLSYNNLV
jgi:hypothetical protein